MTDVERREIARRELRRLGGVLVLLIVIGAASLVASILSARSVAAARRDDVARVQAQSEQNADLLVAVSSQVAEACRIVYAAAHAAGILVEPCSLPEIATPAPSPSPTP